MFDFCFSSRLGFAGLLAAVFVSLVSSPVSAQTARAEFEEAARLTREGRRAEALIHFQRSRELDERPVTVFNIMETLAALGRSREAMVELERFLVIANGDQFAEEREIAESRRQTLLQTLVHVTAELVPEDAEVRVDGELVEGSGSPRVFYVDPGEHTVVARADGYAQSEDQEIAVEAGGVREIQIAFSLTPLPATLVVRSAVDDAMITIDGEVSGQGRVSLDVPAGEHVIEVTAPGREPFVRSVTTSPGERVAVDASLPSIRADGPAPAWKSPVLWTVVGVVLAGAVTTGVILGTRSDALDSSTGVTIGALHAF